MESIITLGIGASPDLAWFITSGLHVGAAVTATPVQLHAPLRDYTLTATARDYTMTATARDYTLTASED